jgi:hypothetical protein
LPLALAAAQTAHELFSYAEPDFLVHTTVQPNDPFYLSGEQWPLRNIGQSGTIDADIDADEGWDTRTEATNIIVAVIDSGIRFTHQDLEPNMWVNPGEISGDSIDNDGNGVIDDVHGYNAISESGDIDDDLHHGTHVAGIIGASGNNGKGITGVAWKVRLMAVKFIGSSGFGYDSDAIEAIDYARRMGASVINASWGGGAYSQALADTIDRTREAGMIFVAAAGNDGVSSDYAPFYPASYPHNNIISVAASTTTDGMASFSNHGLRTVDIAAPGASVYSTYNSSDTAYATLSGTSMAAPHVVGAVALLKAQFPSATPAEIIDRLLATTDHLPSFAQQVRSGGRLNLARALTQTVILPLPVILQQPQGVMAEAGGVAIFTSSVSGGAPLSYQWQVNGVPLPGERTLTLTISNAQPAQAGAYTLLASNLSGVALSEEARLSVVKPVRITAQPVGAILVRDSTFLLTVTATGDEPIRYQWRKEGIDLANATNSTYTIYGVAPQDSGTYSARVSNPVNSVESTGAVLVVLSPPAITLQPTDKIVVQGRSTSFSVQASGTDPLRYGWRKDGAFIAGATSNILTLNNISLSSAGAYSVAVSNSAGTILSASASLTVKQNNGANNYPIFTQQPADATVRAGASVSFSAVAAPSTATLQWRRNGVNLTGATSAGLTLTNVGLADAGAYTLLASNGDGTAASHGAVLTVSEPPVITQQPESITTVAGAPAVFEVNAIGTPPLQYQWFKDGAAMPAATNRRLSFASVSESDTGTYWASVSNTAGEARSLSATLSLRKPAGQFTWRQVEPQLDMNHQFCAAATPKGIVLAGIDAAFSWSADQGRTWTRRPSGLGFDFDGIGGVCYGNGRYVALGRENNTNYAMVSSDGENWTRRFTLAGLPQLHFDGTGFYGVEGPYFHSSTNGFDWDLLWLQGPNLSSICQGDGKYVAVGGQGAICVSTNKETWTLVASNKAIYLLGVCYGAAGFVAVGDRGVVMNSTNGLNWNTPSQPTSQRLRSVDFGNGRYVAVGGSMFIGATQPAVTLVSTDGVTWKRTSNHATGNLLGVTFADGVFVAYGDYGHVLTSQDGEEWTLRRPAATQLLLGIARGSNAFVTVGMDGVIRNSADGVNWITSRPGQSENFHALSFGGGRYVITVEDGAILSSTNALDWQRQETGAGILDCVRYVNNKWFALSDSGEILTSPEGLSWVRAPQVTGAPLKAITYGNGLFVIAGFDGAILTSTTGAIWTLQNTPTRAHLTGIAYGNGKFVAAAVDKTLLLSSDGVTWVAGSTGQSNGLIGVTFANGQFVGTGDGGTILSSPDGESWSLRFSGSTDFNRIQYLNGGFIATGGGTRLAYSKDGVSWIVGTVDYINDVTFGNGKYTAVGLGGRLATATVPTAWSSRSIGSLTSYILTDVDFENGQFLACGRSGNILTSPDGLTWTPQNTGFKSGLEKLAYGAGHHVAVGINGIVLYSTNAVNWTLTSVPGVYQWDSLVFGGGQFIASGWPGAIATSPDGVTWTKRFVPSDDQYNEITYGNNRYVAVGNSSIASSPDGVNWYVDNSLGVGGANSIAFSGSQFVASGYRGVVYTSSNGVNWAVGSRDGTLGLYGMLGDQGAVLGVGDKGVICVSATAPEVLSQPISQAVRAGTNFSLSVSITNASRSSYQWFKDGQAVAGQTGAALSWPRIGPSAAGTYFVRISSLGGTVDSIAAVITIWSRPFDAWRLQHFGESAFVDPAKEATVWGNSADPDHDGLPNIAEYAYGLNPTSTSDKSITINVSTGKLQVTFVRRKNDPSLQIIPEVSSDLAGWRGGPNYVQEKAVVSLGAELDRVTVADIENVPAGTPRFLRLRIEVSP